MEQNILIETLKYFGIAFVSAIILIVISKFILPVFLRKPLDYYNALGISDDDEEEPPLTSADFDQIKQMMDIVYDEMESDIDKELGKNSPDEGKEKNE
ncbi:MAG TPA: hypothetical protein GX736_00595 [Mogibacterium sp.]|nr:hypothetical protein [Mogibacterium sp.]